MADEVKEAKFDPACPYCNMSPAQLRYLTSQSKLGTVLIVCCDNRQCRKIISTTVLPKEQPRIIQPAFRKN